MRVAKLLKAREANWSELDALSGQIRGPTRARNPEIDQRFAALYRAACADLALAEAYQLPPQKVEYLQALVARAHNRLYRTDRFAWRTWWEIIVFRTPRIIYSDRCVQLCLWIWLVLSSLAAYLAYVDSPQSVWPGFTELIMGRAQMESVETVFGNFAGRRWSENFFMMNFYIANNAGIGLRCFALGILVLPGLWVFVQNAIQIGATFGFMMRPDMGIAGLNFRDFVTAHGPFEITAIILSAGAGLRIGVSWLTTQTWTRMSALILAARGAFPIICCAVVLFVLAALIEGFVSPFSRHLLPWWIKGLVAVFSSALMLVYFVILGYPGNPTDEDEQLLESTGN